MNDEVSELKGDKLLSKLDRRDKLTRVLELLVLFVLVGVNLYGLYQIQNIIKTNQASTLEARKANMERQDRIINHLDCVFLLTKRYPNINFQTLNYDESKKYLTECANVQ